MVFLVLSVLTLIGFVLMFMLRPIGARETLIKSTLK
jgi:hypothetical protein